MVKDIKKIGKANDLILKLANGISPVDDEAIKGDNLLNDPRMIRCFFYISNVLDNLVKGEYSKATNRLKFIITDEEKANITFTLGEIGANEISKCINKNINPLISKRTTGNLINRGLKRMEILTEVINDDGSKRTAVNEKSVDYGFLSS